jgi:hypothetical protein
MTDSTERTPPIDPQKGPKPKATPAGVSRIDLAEEGPGMAEANTAGIEENQPKGFGKPADAGRPGVEPPTPPGDDGVA